MGARTADNPSTKGRVFASGPFLAATTVAVVFAALLVWLGSIDRTSSSSTSVRVSPDSSPMAAVPGTSIGSPSAPITMIEYSDFQCSFCQEFALTTMRQIKKEYVDTGKVRFEYRHFVIYGDESMLAAEASEAAAEQGKFWPFYEILMQVRASARARDLTMDRLQDAARQAGLDMVSFDASIKTGKHREKVLRDSEEAESLGITVTPSFSMDGEVGAGAAPFAVFQKLFDERLKTGNKP